MQRLFDNLSKEFEGLDINVGRFVRYVETVVSSRL